MSDLGPDSRHAVRAGVEQWRDALPPHPAPDHLLSRREAPRASTVAVVARLFVWAGACLAWCVGVLWDSLRGRRGVAVRAQRGVRILEDMGGTFVKLGQQLSLRADLLAPEWCEALAQLRDQAPALDPAVAREVVERSTGRALSELFATIDWDQPLGRASIACVYPATLPSGRRVAVKVRRPDVTTGMAADLRLMGRGAWLAEAAGLASPEQAVAFVEHLRTVLLDELDFTRELRNLECFRRSIDDSGLKWLKAPRPFPERCSPEVLTIERVDGVPASVVLAAAEGDAAARASVVAAGIDPRRVGKRLFRAWNEQIFHFERFHGDPHPANLFVGRGDVLWLVDFGACGQFSSASTRVLRRIQVAVLARDLSEMVNGALALLEPHPPVDMEQVARRLERMYADYLASVQSPSAPWWEKATSRFWLSFIEVARDHGIPVNLDTLRLFRASFLMDTLAFRLDPDLDIRDEYAWFFKREHKRRHREILGKGLSTSDGRPVLSLSMLQDTVDVAHRGLGRIEHLLDQRTGSFALAASKGAQAVAAIIRTLQFLVAATLAFGIGRWLWHGEYQRAADLNGDNELQWHELLQDALAGTTQHGVDDTMDSPVYWLVVLFIVWAGLRSVRGRLQDIDP